MAIRIKESLLVALLVTVTHPANAQSDKDIEEAMNIFNRGKSLHQERRYQDAIREYQFALKLDSENPFMHNAMGLALAATGDFKQALVSFEMALKINPDLTDAYNNMGMAYAESGLRDQAFEAFGRAARNPRYLTPEKALYNIGNLYLDEQNLDLALTFFRRAVEKAPEFALGYRGIGKVYLLMEDIEGAEKQFLKAIEIAEFEVESLFQLARICEKRGDATEALKFYRRVVEIDRLSYFGQLALESLDTLKKSS